MNRFDQINLIFKEFKKQSLFKKIKRIGFIRTFLLIAICYLVFFLVFGYKESHAFSTKFILQLIGIELVLFFISEYVVKSIFKKIQYNSFFSKEFLLNSFENFIFEKDIITLKKVFKKYHVYDTNSILFIIERLEYRNFIPLPFNMLGFFLSCIGIISFFLVDEDIRIRLGIFFLVICFYLLAVFIKFIFYFYKRNMFNLSIKYYYSSLLNELYFKTTKQKILRKTRKNNHYLWSIAKL